MLTCAQENEGIKKVRDVHSNALDASEIRRRQAGATLKHGTVKRIGVQVQTVRVHCASWGLQLQSQQSKISTLH